MTRRTFARVLHATNRSSTASRARDDSRHAARALRFRPCTVFRCPDWKKSRPPHPRSLGKLGNNASQFVRSRTSSTYAYCAKIAPKHLSSIAVAFISHDFPATRWGGEGRGGGAPEYSGRPLKIVTFDLASSGGRLCTLINCS